MGKIKYKAKKWDCPDASEISKEWADSERNIKVSFLDISPYYSPETCYEDDGWIYASVAGGKIIRLREDGTGLEEVITGAGLPLGLAVKDENIYFCDMTYDEDGGAICLARKETDYKIEVLAKDYEGKPFYFPDSLCLASDGKVYFTDACEVLVADCKDIDSAASYALYSHIGNGKLYVYDPLSGQTELIATGLHFANGVQLSEKEDFVYVNDTHLYGIWRIDANIRKVFAGDTGTELIYQNLPGYPDNLSRGRNGSYWVGLSSDRVAFVDGLAAKPWVRNLIMKLPEKQLGKLSIPPQGRLHVFSFDESLNICQHLVAADCGLKQVTGVTETKSRLYFHHLDKTTNIAYIEK